MFSKQQQFRIKLDRENALRMTCQNAHCDAEANGWVSALDVHGNEKHAQAARLIENDSGKRFIKLRAEDALDWFAKHGDTEGVTLTPRLHDMIAACPRSFVLYLFPPGQACFKRHLDREVVFSHGARIHERFEDYREDWDETADRVNRLIRAG